MNEINRNFPWCNEYSDKSFLGIFHEEYHWSDAEYFKLENEIYELATKYDGASALPRELVWRAMRIFSYLMVTIGCHFDSNDGFEIENLTNEQIYNNRERAQLVFEGFFEGKMPDRDNFEQ